MICHTCSYSLIANVRFYETDFCPRMILNTLNDCLIDGYQGWNSLLPDFMLTNNIEERVNMRKLSSGKCSLHYST